MTDAASYWDAQAGSFDDAPDHGLRDTAVRMAWTELLAPLLPGGRASIADIGCGTGSLSVLLAAAGHDVHGVDLSPRMIELARVKAAESELAVEFTVADAASPPWPDGRFDLVLSRHVLWALDDRAVALDRWLRLLRTDGRLLLIEGLWWTGAGMRSAEVIALLADAGCAASVTPLPDPALWGGAISDERYMVLAQREATLERRRRQLR